MYLMQIKNATNLNPDSLHASVEQLRRDLTRVDYELDTKKMYVCVHARYKRSPLTGADSCGSDLSVLLTRHQIPVCAHLRGMQQCGTDHTGAVDATEGAVNWNCRHDLSPMPLFVYAASTNQNC